MAQWGVRARAASSKETVSLVSAWFRADSGTNLFKQGEIVTQRLECSHSKLETLCSSPGRAKFFFRACDAKKNNYRANCFHDPIYKKNVTDAVIEL